MEVEVPSTEKDGRVEDAVGGVCAYARAEGHGVKEGFVEGALGGGDGDYDLTSGSMVFRHGITQCVNAWALFGPIEFVLAGWQWTGRYRGERPPFCKQVRIPSLSSPPVRRHRQAYSAYSPRSISGNRLQRTPPYRRAYRMQSGGRTVWQIVGRGQPPGLSFLS